MGQAAAGGLALMMLVAVIVRIQIKDTLLQTIPALFYLTLNIYPVSYTHLDVYKRQALCGHEARRAHP